MTRSSAESAQQEEGFELYSHDAAKAERGARAAVIGAVAGIIPAIGLGCLRVLNSEPPETADQIAGNMAFILVYASPYLLALMASRARDRRRGRNRRREGRGHTGRVTRKGSRTWARCRNAADACGGGNRRRGTP